MCGCFQAFNSGFSRVSSNSSITFRFSYQGTGSLQVFYFWVSTLVSCDSLYSPVCLSSFGGSSLSCDLIFLMDLKRIFDFLVWLAFCLFFGWSGNFWAFYMLGNQKPWTFLYYLFIPTSRLNDMKYPIYDGFSPKKKAISMI